MKIQYRKSLENAARQMILVHRADSLIKLILKTIVKNIQVKHAGMFIYDKKRDAYVVRVSRGAAGFRIPSGFTKVKRDNSLIRYFTQKNIPFPKEAILWDKIPVFMRSQKVKKNLALGEFLHNLKLNLSLYQARICIPGFFRDELIGVLFLGEKQNQEEFFEEELGFLSVLSSDVVMAIKNAWLIEDLNHQLQINKRLFLQTVSALASSIEAKDEYTKGHTDRVLRYSLAIAGSLQRTKKISDWNKFLEDLKIAALLHDIGKIGIPEPILNKQSALSKQERKIVNQHPQIGARILESIEEFKEASLGVRHHHERYDGSGYPLHLKGRKIPLIASVIALADAFDAMIIDRPYSKALSLKKALGEIKRNRGKHFSPKIVDAFLRVYKNL